MFHSLKRFKDRLFGLRRDTKGATPSQIGLAIVILVSLAYAGINAFESTSAGADQRTVASDLTTIWTTMDTTYFTGYPSGAFTTDIRGHLPEFMQGASNTVKNKYGANVLFEGVVASSLPAAQVTYPGVPKATCENLLMSTPIGGKSRFFSVAVNGGTAITATVTTQTAAQTACSASRNSFVFIRFDA